MDDNAVLAAIEKELVGKWSLDRTENFDAALEEMGIVYFAIGLRNLLHGFVAWSLQRHVVCKFCFYFSFEFIIYIERKVVCYLED